jgi:hypothetical protein
VDDVAVTERVLRRVGDDPYFLGSALTAYQHCSGADVGDVATFLGCPVAALPRLALARRPDPHSPRFRRDLARLAARSGAAEGRLPAVLQFWHRGGGVDRIVGRCHERAGGG